MSRKAINSFVLDCSVTMSWYFPDEITASVQQLLHKISNSTIIRVPAIWSFEVLNVIAIAERNKRTTQVESSRFINLLNELPLDVDLEGLHFFKNQILELSREYHLTAYDAAYLELAFREKIPIATLDKALKRVAKKLNIDLLL